MKELVQPNIYYSTQALMISFLILILPLGLLCPTLVGLLIYQLVEMGSKVLEKIGLIPARGKIILLILMLFLVVSACVFSIVSLASYMTHGPENFFLLMQKIANIVETGMEHLPFWAKHYFPSNITEWQSAFSGLLRENIHHFSEVGREAVIYFFRVIIAMVIGGMIALNPGFQGEQLPIAIQLKNRFVRFNTSFGRILFAQIRISLLNTILTGIFLLIFLPLTGTSLPFSKTILLLTFIFGLLPIVGNVFSNSIIFLVGLSVSLFVAIEALIFLMAIHKLEYFINAHIIGSKIRCKAWEILLAMIFMESIFGIIGLIAAPIYYAYLKDEFSHQD